MLPWLHGSSICFGSSSGWFRFRGQTRVDSLRFALCSIRLHNLGIMCCREKQELEQLEGSIDGLGSSKAALERELDQLAGRGEKYEEMLQISQRLAALVTEIDAKTERWLDLADRAEQHSAV